MHEERMKILEMLAEGKINAEEAQNLLGVLGQKEDAGSKEKEWDCLSWCGFPFGFDFGDCFKDMFNEDFFAQCCGNKKEAEKEKQEA